MTPGVRDELTNLVADLVGDAAVRLRDGASERALDQAIAAYAVDRPVDCAEAGDSVPLVHRLPVAGLAASLLLEQLAVLAAGDGDSTITADSVDHKSASELYAARARAAKRLYDDRIGITPVGAAEVAIAARKRPMGRW